MTGRHDESYDVSVANVPVEAKFDDLCNELKIDNAIQEEAWEKYKDVWNSYSLDGDHLQWLVCALYECFQKPHTNPEIYGGAGGMNDPDYPLNSLQVSLHKLIHSAGMTYVQFFYRIKKWSEMVEMSDALRDRIEILERQFAVACVLYSKYSSVFLTLFQRSEFTFLNLSADSITASGSLSTSVADKDAEEGEIDDSSNVEGNKKGHATGGNKRGGGGGGGKKSSGGTATRKGGNISSGMGNASKKACSVQDLYKFTWLLFVQVRSNFPAVCDDLVNSYHLLLCVVEFVYSNAISAHRKDLLNTSFPATATLMQSSTSGLTSGSVGGGSSTRTVAAVKEERTELALRLLCDIHGCQFVHCKSLIDFHVRPYLRRLIEKDYLKGRHLTLTGILDPSNFYASNRLLNTIYEDCIRCSGAFDERLLFLPDNELRNIIGSGKDHLRIAKVLPAPILSSYQTPLAKRYMNKRASLVNVSTTVSTDSPVKSSRIATTANSGGSAKELRKDHHNVAENVAVNQEEKTDNGKAVPLIFTAHDKASASVMQRYCVSVHLNTQEERNHCLHQVHQILSQNLNIVAPLDDPNEIPSESLRNIITSHCGTQETTTADNDKEESIMVFIQRIVQHLANQFCDKAVQEFVFCKKQEERQQPFNATVTPLDEESLTQQAWDAAIQRMTLIQSLYYLFLERILMEEVSKIDTNESERLEENQACLRRFLMRETFHKSLFALSVEIVHRLCNPIHEFPFPWSLQCFELSAYHMYKLLGLLCYLMQSEFPRELVRYLNALSEHIVDNLAWRRESPLWTALRRKEEELQAQDPTAATVHAVPRIVDVMPVDMFEKPKPSLTRRTVVETDAASGHQITFSLGESPMKAAASMASGSGASQSGGTGGTSQSGGTGGSGGGTSGSTGKTEGAGGGSSSGSTSVRIQNVTSSGGRLTSSSGGSSGSNATQIFQIIRPTGSSGGTGGITTGVAQSVAATTKSHSGLPLTLHPLDVFFRHLYYVASCRLRDLCERLAVNKEVLAKSWTCLEICLREQTHLMCDRHLDSLILCCLYGVNTATSNKQLGFLDLVQAYRIQPHSQREVYRSILLDNMPTEEDQFMNESYGDVLQFYNHVFLPLMTNHIKQFAGLHSALMRNPLNLPYTLSPVPVKPSEIKINNRSIRRLVTGRNVYVSPVKNQVQMSPKRIIFSMQQSPSKELREINSMLFHHERKSHLNNTMNVGIKRVHPSILHGITTHFSQPSQSFSSSSFPKRLHFDN